MGESGVDIVSVDWTVDMAEARRRLGPSLGVQGNIDPAILFGSQALIRDRILDTIQKAGNRGHILNLGHGILPAPLKKTPPTSLRRPKTSINCWRPFNSPCHPRIGARHAVPLP
jgi:uroporphyrinogen-III decarboxylase